MPLISKHFTSSRDLAEWFTTATPAPVERDRWHFAADTIQVNRGLRTLTEGDLANLSQAQELLDQFQESVEVPAYVPQLSMAGGFPDVPAFLSGQPEHMYSLQPTRSERSPLRILVGITSSAAVSQDQLVKRGCTLAAFALALSSRRPVYITPFLIDGLARTSHRAIISWDVATSPLVLSELMGCLSTPALTRYFGLAATARLHPSCDGSITPYDVTEAQVRASIPSSQDAIYLPPIHWYDPLLENPLAWIKDNLAKYTQEDN